MGRIWLDPQNAAKTIGLSQRQFNRQIEEGKIAVRPIRFGIRVFFVTQEVIRAKAQRDRRAA